MSCSSSSVPETELPLKPIPGDYGLPFFGAIKDRVDYFYTRGKDEFFASKVKKYNSTVIRTNMPPGPFIARDPKVVALLDALSFPTLFDMNKVEKRNVFEGTFMPSLSFTGGYRVCAQLDPSEPTHASLKSFILSTMASLHSEYIPVFRSCFSLLFIDIDNEMASSKKANFNNFNDPTSFSFVFRLFSNNKDPSSTKIGEKGSSLADKWLFLQLAPISTLGLPKILNAFEDLLLHTFPLPSLFIKSDYKTLYDAFYTFSSPVLDKAEKFGISKEEACHNLLYLSCFNTYGGMKVLFPAILKWVGGAGQELHRQLAKEIRTVIKDEGNVVTLKALEKMTLTKSVVYEVLRIDPPVPFQYGKAKEDIIVQNHDSRFLIKKGEMIFGYQPFATKDPLVFDRPEEFVGHRFMGPEGEKLLKFVFWSNGREIDDPTASNKQCPGKDQVVLLSRLLLVELFLRYDTFTVDWEPLLLGSTVTFTSLTKATTSSS